MTIVDRWSMTNVDKWSMTNVDPWSMTNVDTWSMTNVDTLADMDWICHLHVSLTGFKLFYICD